jgi:aspartate aminotransferase
MSLSKTITDRMTRSSWIRKMFEIGIVLKAEHGAENVFDFSLGNPDLPSPAEFDRILVEEAQVTGGFVHGYMPNAGYPETRRAIADLLAKDTGLPISEDHVLMSCGAAGAINVFLKSVLDPGDEVIVIAPCFVEYNFYITNHQGVQVISESTEDLLPDIDDLEQRITHRTKAIIINSPNNPSGRVYSEKLLKELGTFLQSKSKQLGRPIYLLADEPYRKIIFDDKPYQSPFRYYRNTVLATSFSKDLSLAGERIGYLAVSPLIDDAHDLINAATFCTRILGYINAPALMQRVIPRVLNAKVDVSIYQKRRDLFCNALLGMGYDVIIPEGTFYVFPRTPIPDDVAYVKALQKHMILTSPGSGFHRSGHFRVALCVPESTIRRSLDGFDQTIQEFKN